MKTEPNEPINSISLKKPATYEDKIAEAMMPEFKMVDYTGLTKREYFAGIALQGIQLTLGNVDYAKAIKTLADKSNEEFEYYLAEMAVVQADALITALNNH